MEKSMAFSDFSHTVLIIAAFEVRGMKPFLSNVFHNQNQKPVGSNLNCCTTFACPHFSACL